MGIKTLLSREEPHMKKRRIEEIIRPPAPHWVGNGFRVQQYFPKGRGKGSFDRFSPFILLDYNAKTFFKGTSSMVGVGPHPHRGFETVTFAFEGKVEHGDNQGNHGIIGPGDIQWMSAGSGILHKEYHEREYAKNDRHFHMIQLWVNLPSQHKMTPPKYQALLKEDMGKALFAGGEFTVYAGEAGGAKGPAHSFSPMNIYMLSLEKDAAIDLEEPGSYNLALLILEGEVLLQDTLLKASDFALMKNEEGTLTLRGVADRSDVFILSGEPLQEPVVAGGPFVMNTEEELLQAFEDYESGLFGSHDF